MALTYLEKLQARSPSTSSHDHMGGSRATFTYWVANVDEDTLSTVIDEVLGYNENIEDEPLRRTPPKRHPHFAWMYANRILSITGVGLTTDDVQQGLTEEDVDVGTEAMTEETSKYWTYEIVVEFTPRLYSLVADEDLTTSEVTWYDDDDNETVNDCSNEWIRYTDSEVVGTPEIITAQQGQSYFVTELDDLGSLLTFPPHGIPFQGFPRIIAARETVSFRWYMVPESYILHPTSYIRLFQGHVNQLEWYGYAPGELLYDRYTYKRNPPAHPALIISEGGASFSPEKWCDIEFIFLRVIRTQEDVPDFSAINRNWVASGHNLLPWFGNRKFYHAIYPKQTDKDNTAFWIPTYPSRPFQLLFKNPAIIG